MARIVSLGSGLQDIYLIDHDDLGTAKPENNTLDNMVLGSKVDIDRVSFQVGGGGVNSAITFARHGHEAIFIGNLSHDPAGAAIIKKLNREAIDTSYINFLERRNTGTSVVLLDTKSGERTILTYRGASKQFGNLPENDLDLIRPDWLYVTSLRGDLDSLKRFFKKAHSLGIRVMFNPGVKELEQAPEVIKLLKYVTILNLNKSEAAKLVNGSLLTELLGRLKNYTNYVIITDGSMGGIAADGVETYRFGIYEDVKMKDATGAGDAFGSGFLAHLTSGKSFKSSLIFAAANSTSVIQKIGGSDGALTGQEKLHPMPIQKI